MDRLLDRALDLPAEQRLAFVRESAGNDQALRVHLERLLTATDEGFTEAARRLPRAVANQMVPGRPATVGPYRLCETLGHGGMGAVYRAERDIHGATQEVALKMIRPELLPLVSPETVRRFEQERAVLSRLVHPHIARFIDGGETPEGTPFLAMEFVRGKPITSFCNEAALPLSARIRLIQEVAHALAFAHRQLVVHRDLKPSNLLVTQTDEGTISPKVIDFGIAKLLTPDPLLELPLTDPGFRVLTPEYAAPEQILGGDVGTAADIYALGVVLYEVLTGVRPFQADTREALQHAVCNTPPPRPSLRVEAESVTHPSLSSRRLRGDLDWICLKALHKDPEQRYRSASELADDLENVCQQRPVLARRPTVRYRAARFASRNRALLIATAAVFAALLVGLGSSLWQARAAAFERDRAAAEAQRSEQASAFLANLLELGDPYDSPLSIPALALADSGLARLQRDEVMDPILKAEIAHKLAHVFHGQGRFTLEETAARLGTEALEGSDATPEFLARTHLAHAEALREIRRSDESVSAARRAAAHASQVPEDVELLTDVAMWLGRSLAHNDQTDEAIEVLNAAIIRLEAESAPDSSNLLSILDAHAMTLKAAGRIDEALTVGSRALALSRQVLGRESANAQVTPHNYALILIDAKRYAEAEALLDEVIQREASQLGRDHPSRAISVINLSDLQLRMGRLRIAEERSAEAVRILEAAAGDTAPPVIQGRIIQAVVAARLGRQREAEALFRRLLRMDEAALPSLIRAEVEFLYGTTLLQTGRVREGEDYRREAQAILSPAERVSLEEMFGLASGGSAGPRGVSGAL